uniref:Uncharacterized protein n=1 Tax=Arundo donax TaxID=35708 RepID=A0A0A9EAI7_ARUDO
MVVALVVPVADPAPAGSDREGMIVVAVITAAGADTIRTDVFS